MPVTDRQNNLANSNNSLWAIDPNLRTPYVQQWSFGYERKIAKDMAFEIRYSANHGIKLYRAVDFKKSTFSRMDSCRNSDAFVYKVGIKNDSDKTITEFDWDYVFFDAATGAEIGRRQFTGVEKIGPGKSKELTFQVSSPPAMTISVYALDKSERRGLSEAVVLVRVAYADRSVWLRQ